MKLVEEINEILDEIADNCKTKNEFLMCLSDLEDMIQLKRVAADDIDWSPEDNIM